MLVEWESFSCFGFVKLFRRIPDFIPTNNIHEPSEHCLVRIQISIYGPEWSLLEKVSQPHMPKKTRHIERKTEQMKLLFLARCVYWLGSVIRVQLGICGQSERTLRFLLWMRSASFMPESKTWPGYDAMFLIFSCCFLKNGYKMATTKSFVFLPSYGSGSIMPLENN